MAPAPPRCFGLSLSAPASRLEDSWLNDLIETANEISHALGYNGE